MKLRVWMGLLLALGMSSATAQVVCNGANENLLRWPADNPVWEMCWLTPANSSGPRGSGMELRRVHYVGTQVLKTLHSPILFAEYASSTCYRDWKDSMASFVAEPVVRNQLGETSAFLPTTSCDRSQSNTQSYGNCPFQLPGRTSSDCFSGLSIEDRGDHVVLTTQYDASWYAYTSRAIFYANGAFDLQFGFGNFSNTSNGTTHWHHNYWRLDFDIGDAGSDILSINDVAQDTEFTSLRSQTGGPGGTELTWEVRDANSGLGYRMVPSRNDYQTPTNQSGRNFHMVDVIGTVYKANEYGDRSNNNLGDCAMTHGNLANGESIGGAGVGADVVLYYRAAVRDQAGIDAMLCKSAGPLFVPLGNFDQYFENGFED
ncbi:MAG: hypothetical protein KDI48_13980 [Xanthomonadales bacterium]|nr:hypothetical protein [Xanthomonadales bacterium]